MTKTSESLAQQVMLPLRFKGFLRNLLSIFHHEVGREFVEERLWLSGKETGISRAHPAPRCGPLWTFSEKIVTCFSCSQNSKKNYF
ncbi:Terminal Nucleotidyltransferase 4A [Manis pentadactyla]|nr:Terminal Nucleotidyltransferase 4A [Manis pentadactyla]